jgi:hypothetical protein
MKTFKFKQEFEDKLGNDREAYFNNLRLQNRYTFKRLIKLNSITKFEDFICDSFLWKDTKEGYEFWKQISIK